MLVPFATTYVLVYIVLTTVSDRSVIVLVFACEVTEAQRSSVTCLWSQQVGGTLGGACTPGVQGVPS